MWPWSIRTAIAATATLLVLLVGGLIVSAVNTDFPSPQFEVWAFLLAILVGLVPLILVLLDFAAARQARVGISSYFTLDFSAATGEIARGESLTPNIVSPGVNVADSGNEQMRSALAAAAEFDVVEVDLRSGEAWWPTRLFVLAAGAARTGRPGAIAFVGRQGGRNRVFLGWAEPRELLEQMLHRDPELRVAYWNATRSWEEQLKQVSPIGPGFEQVDLLRTRNPPAGPVSGSWVPSPFGQEMVLTREVTHLEPPEHGISGDDLRQLIGPVLHMDAIDLAEAPEAQVDRVLRTQDRYIAVTSASDFMGLARVDVVSREVLRSALAGLRTGDAER